MSHEAPSEAEGGNPVTAATRAQEKWAWQDREPTSTALDDAEGGNPVTAAMRAQEKWAWQDSEPK